MFNSVCSPEISFNEDVGDEPHAYVSYQVGGEKEYKPISFIYQFPPTWREDGFKKKYLYKVFWSPNPGDTPRKMLQSKVEIPTYEDSSLENPGYYRAAVVCVAG